MTERAMTPTTVFKSRIETQTLSQLETERMLHHGVKIKKTISFKDLHASTNSGTDAAIHNQDRRHRATAPASTTF
jgi:hypothetical protein